MSAMKYRLRMRTLVATGLALFIWLSGVITMQLPLGDPLMRLSYDYLNLCLSHEPDPNVVVIALKEETDRKLGKPPGEPLSRSLHAKLLERLKDVGVDRVCYDILFDRAGLDPQADESFAAAIKDEGNVFLGGMATPPANDGMAIQSADLGPTPLLLKAAKGWGLLNVGIVDPDGVIRQFHTGINGAPALAVVAALPEGSEALTPPFETRWLYYQAMPGHIPTYEFADCLDPKVVPDEKLHGKTIFIGGEYESKENGGRAEYPTPFTHMSARDIADVEWQANAFVNAHNDYWFVPAEPIQSAFWCLPLAVLPWLLLARIKRKWIIAGWGTMAILLIIAAIVTIANDQVMFNWLAIPIVQIPTGMVAAAVWIYLGNVLGRWKKDIFVSYRRLGGGHLAGRIKVSLEAKGFSVFMDDDLESGKFDDALLRKIEGVTDVIVILTQGSLDRCKDENDWLRREVRHAIERERNIVPVMDQGFQMPPVEVLPPDIAELPRYNGLTLTHERFQASIDELATKFLKSKATWR